MTDKKKQKLTKKKSRFTILNIINIDKKGDIFATKTHYKRKKNIQMFKFKTPTNNSQCPKENDKILVQMQNQKKSPYNGEIIRLFPKTTKAENTILAITKSEKNKISIIPIEKNENAQYSPEKKNSPEKIKNAMLVEAQIKGRQKTAHITHIIHQFKDKDIDPINNSIKTQTAIEIAQYQFKLPGKFSQDTVNEIKKIKPFNEKTKSHHQDYTNIPFITIDPEDAKDHDDAIFAQYQKNNQTCKIIVAIADVAYYVNENSPIDKDAYQRGNSIYFPGTVIPMLPEKLSNQLCSLKKNQIRPVIVAEMIFNKNGERINAEIKRVKIKTVANLTYTQMQNVIEGKNDTTIPKNIKSPLQNILKAWDILKKIREKRQPLNINMPEYKIITKQNGEVENIQNNKSLEANQIIEECMIQANTLIAQTLKNKEKPFISRQHQKPESEKVEKLNAFLQTIGYKIPRPYNVETQYFNHILKNTKEKQNEDIIHEAVLRTQSQAVYTHKKASHFGLNLKDYTHFTSPIRRYCDLTIHRQLIKILNLETNKTKNISKYLSGENSTKENTTKPLSEIAEHISETERRAINAERATHARLIANYIIKQEKRIFPAYISAVIARGLFVKLEKIGAEGFIPASKLEGGKPNFNPKTQTLRMGRQKPWKIGQNITVYIEEINPLNGNLRCVMMEKTKKPNIKNKA